jgi:hypothetical protein
VFQLPYTTALPKNLKKGSTPPSRLVGITEKPACLAAQFNTLTPKDVLYSDKPVMFLYYSPLFIRGC